jgi:hypothetical protein
MDSVRNDMYVKMYYEYPEYERLVMIEDKINDIKNFLIDNYSEATLYYDKKNGFEKLRFPLYKNEGGYLFGNPIDKDVNDDIYCVAVVSILNNGFRCAAFKKDIGKRILDIDPSFSAVRNVHYLKYNKDGISGFFILDLYSDMCSFCSVS